MTSDKYLGTGDVIGRYRIERLIGSGGMGQVYQATHTRLGKPVAIKLLNRNLSSQEQYIRRFFNEAKAAAQLQHINIIDVTDLDQLPDGRLYMVLEYLDGETLADFLDRERRVDAETALAILQPICSAIAAAHGKGIIHRDLKPANIFLVSRKGAGRLIKVLDFGVAKLRDPSLEGDVTRTGVALGTPGYMSPEQEVGRSQDVGPASDVYSTGVLAFKMLTGQVPERRGPDVLGTGDRRPPSLRDLRPDVPAKLEPVIARALEWEPARRWSTMEELCRAFAHSLGVEAQLEIATPAVDPGRAAGGRAAISLTSTKVLGRAPVGGQEARDPSARSRRAWLLGAALLGVLVVAGLLSAHAWRLREAEPAEEHPAEPSPGAPTVFTRSVEGVPSATTAASSRRPSPAPRPVSTEGPTADRPSKHAAQRPAAVGGTAAVHYDPNAFDPP